MMDDNPTGYTRRHNTPNKLVPGTTLAGNKISSLDSEYEYEMGIILSGQGGTYVHTAGFANMLACSPQSRRPVEEPHQDHTILWGQQPPPSPPSV